MMEKARILEKLIKEQGYNLKTFAAQCQMPYTTLYGIIKKGVSRASVDNLIIICRKLGIQIEDLERMAKGEPEPADSPSYEDLQSLIARNGKNLSVEQKQEIIRTLLSEE